MKEKSNQNPGFRGKIADLSEDAAAKVKELIEGFTSMGQKTQERIISNVNRIFDLSPAFETAGYRINRVILSISLPPSIEVFFSRYKELSPDELEQVRNEYSDRKLFHSILDSLVFAHRIQDRISTEDLVFADVAIELSVPPKISLRYLNSEIANLSDRKRIEIETG